MLGGERLWHSAICPSTTITPPIGKPQPALTFEERDGLFVRKDPVSGHPVAVTVVQYERHFRKLDDVSWVGERHLPKNVTDFLLDRPSFISL
jgi:hypothetical protein